MNLKPINQTEEEIFKLERKIWDDVQVLREMKQKLARTRIEDYEFQTLEGPVRLSQLFGDKKELIVVHNMGQRCSFCTLWADGFNGVVHHLENRAAFVVSSPDDPSKQRTLAGNRGWKFRMVSVQNSAFAKDMEFQNGDNYLPGVSTFIKEADGIYRAGRAVFGPGDLYCSTWHLFDLLPDSDWAPKMSYLEKSKGDQ